MNQPNHRQIATYLTDYALSELVKYVMEDTGCSIEQAMERVYNSPLMEILQDEENDLYVQSPAYLYELMERLNARPEMQTEEVPAQPACESHPSVQHGA